MDSLLEFTERPAREETVMVAGWRQWADAGDVSSGLPEYLVSQVGARKIGEIKSDSFFIFQIPGTHHFLRPEIKLEDGHRKELRHHRSEIYYGERGSKGILLFLGDEPHLNIERYAEAFFHIATESNAKRVIGLGGVYGAVPFDKDRHVLCTYSLPRMKKELDEYALQFSNYEGGVSIGSYLADRAEEIGMEYASWYAMVPMYDLAQLSPLLEGISIEHDWKAWYDITQRLNHMFKLGLDLADLQQHSRELITTIKQQLDDLEAKVPQAGIQTYLEKLAQDFTDTSFMPLDDAWERGLGDLLNDIGI